METPVSEPAFTYRADGRELRVHRVAETLTLPIENDSHDQQPFHEALSKAFARVAARGGKKPPMVVGALPFDLTASSWLYVTDDYDWQSVDGDEVGTLAPSAQEEGASIAAVGLRMDPAASMDSAAPMDPAAAKAKESGHVGAMAASGEAATTAGAMPVLQSQCNRPDEAGFKEAVRRAVINFQQAGVSKVVLSVMRDLNFESPVDINVLMSRLAAQNPTGYRFRLALPDGGTLLGVSPELLIRKQGAHITSNPLAGSARRMPDPVQDQQNADRLMASDKDQYEHRLVIEDIRSRLQPLCAQLDVPAKPSLINTAALWHLSTRIEGTAHDPDMSALQFAGRLHPTPAVCGMPTDRARRLMQSIEPFRRGLFTGAVGWMDAQGNGEWVVTIRCGIVNGRQMQLFAGAGIVAASQPESEWAEVQTKLGTMLRACGIQS